MNFMLKHFVIVELAVVLFAVSFWGPAAHAQSVVKRMAVTVDAPVQLQEREPLVEIPRGVPNPDPRVTESMIINTERLHGFPTADLERESFARIAMISGADSPGTFIPGEGFGEYRLDAGDSVEFLSFDNENLNREVTIRYDGQISLPLIPDIEVGGQTRAEAEQTVRDAYTAVFRDPEISLTVLDPKSKTYTVLGDVENPGRYPYLRKTSLLEALSEAGGLERVSNNGGNRFIAIAGQITKAFIIRTVDGERHVEAFDLRGIGEEGAHAGDTPIYYGDVVYVPEGVNLVYLMGENRTPTIIELTEGLTLVQMLGLAGGFNESTGRLKEVVLLRNIDEENTELHLINLRAIFKNKGSDVRLQPGDVVYIPRKRILRLQEFVQRFTGSISPLLDLYTTAITSFFRYDIQNLTLDNLRN